MPADVAVTMKRITILVGEFGSGKTELAVHFALQLAGQGCKTAIIDMDLAKPYFRTRENREVLEAKGVYVIAPEPRLAHAGLPLLPADLARILYDESVHVVMDVGGGDSSVVLGQLQPYFRDNEYQAVLVVNTLRPFTADPDGIVCTLRRIEAVSRLTVSALAANTNLAGETTADHVLEGLSMVTSAASRLNLPVCCVVIPEWLRGKVDTKLPVCWLRPQTRYPWME